jgi:hypothetical protein
MICSTLNHQHGKAGKEMFLDKVGYIHGCFGFCGLLVEYQQLCSSAHGKHCMNIVCSLAGSMKAV